MESKIKPDSNTVFQNTLDKTIRRIQQTASDSESTGGLPTGFTKLDDITNGFQRGDFFVIGGRPAMGKTALALSIINNLCKNKHSVLFFSLIDSSETVALRLISNNCLINYRTLIRGTLNDEEWSKLDKRISNMEQYSLIIDDENDIDIEYIKKKTNELVQNGSLDLVMIDCIQFIENNNPKAANKYEQMADITRELKNLARKCDVPILATSQLNRKTIGKEEFENLRPELFQLRDSGTIEDDADVVLLIHRPEYYHIYHDENGDNLRGMAQIIVAKNNRGPRGDVLLKFQGEYLRFDVPEDTYVLPIEGGEIKGSRMNLPPDADPFGTPQKEEPLF